MFLLVPAYPGSPRPQAVKWLCVCVCYLFIHFNKFIQCNVLLGTLTTIALLNWRYRLTQVDLYKGCKTGGDSDNLYRVGQF